MGSVKFNGVLQEIVEQYPNIDISGYLADKLQIPLDKAEALAARIVKQYCQKKGPTEQKMLRLLEVSSETELPKTSVYPLDNLSEKEFDYFIKWLLGEFGYEIQERYPAKCGVNLVALIDSKKILVQARRYPKTHIVSDAILLAQKAKPAYGCEKSIVIATAHFTEQAKAEAQKLSVELWDIDALAEKITAAREKVDLEVQACFPKYKGNLLQSLLGLEETKNFLIEPKADGKYDVHLPGVKYPLLTFQVRCDAVVRCVFRIRYNEPVGENDGEVLISCEGDNRQCPDDVQAYGLIIQYLVQFLE